jgi:hypothetical protein
MLNNRITVGTRALAAIVITVTALWYLSVGIAMNSVKGTLSLFWWAVLVLFPLTALIFAAIMWWSYIRSDRAYSPWVAIATLLLLLPALMFLLIYFQQI